MYPLLITISLLLVTLVTMALWGLALVRLRRGSVLDQRLGIVQWWGLASITVACLAMFISRWLLVTGQWLPLRTHLDGLLLIASLLGGAILFMHARPRLRGLTAFALPALLLALLWAICAANWTYQPFEIAPGDLWLGLHLVTIYTGTVSAFIAAVAGGMYLFIQRRLRHKTPLEPGGKLASLETLEAVIVRTATLGFTLLTLGLLSGLIIVSERSTMLGPSWYASPKVWLAATAWLIYALIMNVRYASAFRGARAAYLSIAGMVLLLATYGVATSLPGRMEPVNSPKANTTTTLQNQEGS